MSFCTFFHGTTRNVYDNALKEFGVYGFLADRVELNPDYATAFGHAIRRGCGYGGLILLVVDPRRAKGFVQFQRYECDSLGIDAYRIVDIEVDNFSLSDGTLQEIERARAELCAEISQRKIISN